jgi:hypothetical protein
MRPLNLARYMPNTILGVAHESDPPRPDWSTEPSASCSRYAASSSNIASVMVLPPRMAYDTTIVLIRRGRRYLR